MTPEERAREVCESKVTYLSELCATNAAFVINLRNVGTGQEIQTPYKCRVCPDWHLTSHPTIPQLVSSYGPSALSPRSTLPSDVSSLPATG